MLKVSVEFYENEFDTHLRVKTEQLLNQCQPNNMYVRICDDQLLERNLNTRYKIIARINCSINR